VKKKRKNCTKLRRHNSFPNKRNVSLSFSLCLALPWYSTQFINHFTFEETRRGGYRNRWKYWERNDRRIWKNRNEIILEDISISWKFYYHYFLLEFFCVSTNILNSKTRVPFFSIIYDSSNLHLYHIPLPRASQIVSSHISFGFPRFILPIGIQWKTILFRAVSSPLMIYSNHQWRISLISTNISLILNPSLG